MTTAQTPEHVYPLIVEGAPPDRQVNGAVAELTVDSEGMVRAQLRIAGPPRP